MFDSKLRIMSLLVFVLLTTAAVAPVFAFSYMPGVTIGQYVKYGNFLGTGPGLEAYNNNDWMKYEVVDLNGTQATLLSTGRFKNGTAILGNGDSWTYDLTIPGIVNGTYSPQGPIIAANLSKGSMVTPVPFDTINDTETRIYWGFSRTVNILNYTEVTENSASTFTYIYDQTSGMLLELKGETIETQPTPVTRQFSYGVTDTNIFGPNSGIPIVYFYIIAVAAISAVAVAVTAIALKKRAAKRSKTKRRRR